MLAFYLLLASVTIRNGGSVLRAGCDPDSDRVAALSAGQPATVKFALAGAGGACYKIAVEVDGRTLTGYVRRSALDGLDSFDQDRQQASAIAAMVLQNHAAGTAANSALGEAIAALQANQPARAAALLDPIARKSRNANVLALAGVAALRNDDPPAALDYWKRALEIRADPMVERMYEDLRRSAAGDRSSGRLVGLRVVLRYEPDSVDLPAAHALLLALDVELGRISTELGCAMPERLVAIVQSRDAYRNSSGQPEWSAGLYDGRIRVALIDGPGIGPLTRLTFAHELTHACLASIGSFPPWLHEGIAQRMSGGRLTPARRKRIQEAIAAKQLPRLEQLDPRGSDEERAHDIYGLALWAADVLFEKHGGMGIRNILANRGMLRQITAELDRELGL